MTAMRRWPIAIVAALLLSACAHVPTRPSIAALPGSAKNAAEFRSDDAACRQLAAVEAKATAKWRYDMTYLQCMYAKGNQIPVPAGSYEPANVSPGSSVPAAAPAPATSAGSETTK
jgi:hypothetical protein